MVRLGLESSQFDQAIADNRRGVNEFPDQFDLRWSLANLLIMKGDKEGLLEQIEELKRRNTVPELTEFLKVNHYILVREWPEARQLLVRIQSDLDKFGMTARVNELMAICYGEMGDFQSQEAALRRAVAVNPKSTTARQELVEKLVKRGDINQAIEEYKDLINDVPQVWSSLARLMILSRPLYVDGQPELDRDRGADQSSGEGKL